MKIIILYLLFISFIVWIFFVPSGNNFFRKTIRDYKKWIAEQNELINLAKSFSQNTNFKKLISELKRISTFSEVEVWDNKAQLELSRITSKIQQLDTKINQCEQNLHSSYLRLKLFKLALEKINRNYKNPLENMANTLQEAIDFTPNSPEEQKELIQELKKRKKELQLQKREASVKTKEIRRKARVKSTHAGGLFYDSKRAARQRRYIRYQKEAELRPNEDLIAAVERQILQIDKDIFWAESITN